MSTHIKSNKNYRCTSSYQASIGSLVGDQGTQHNNFSAYIDQEATQWRELEKQHNNEEADERSEADENLKNQGSLSDINKADAIIISHSDKEIAFLHNK